MISRLWGKTFVVTSSPKRLTFSKGLQLDSECCYVLDLYFLFCLLCSQFNQYFNTYVLVSLSTSANLHQSDSSNASNLFWPLSMLTDFIHLGIFLPITLCFGLSIGTSIIAHCYIAHCYYQHHSSLLLHYSSLSYTRDHHHSSLLLHYSSLSYARNQHHSSLLLHCSFIAYTRDHHHISLLLH